MKSIGLLSGIGRLPVEVAKAARAMGSDIHRSCIMYDFNVVDLTGAGLVLGEYERDIFV